MRRLAIYLAIGAVIAVVGFVFRDRLSSNASDLKVGDCFDNPAGTTITDVQHHPCTESHSAEVVFLGKLPGSDVPTTATVDDWVRQNCVPAWNAYTGKDFESEALLGLSFYQPTDDGWRRGDRDIVCYATREDGAAMTRSVKAGTP